MKNLCFTFNVCEVHFFILLKFAFFINKPSFMTEYLDWKNLNILKKYIHICWFFHLNVTAQHRKIKIKKKSISFKTNVFYEKKKRFYVIYLFQLRSLWFFLNSLSSYFGSFRHRWKSVREFSLSVRLSLTVSNRVKLPHNFLSY